MNLLLLLIVVGLIILAGIFIFSYNCQTFHQSESDKKCEKLSELVGIDVPHVAGKSHDIYVGVRQCKVCEKWYHA